jgi:hypothetical protein
MECGQLPNLIWYGERGIVNSIVAQMGRSEVGFVNEVKKFLGAVQWADGNPAGWIDQVDSAHAIVELGCGQFGDPDLIIVCDECGGEKRVVFVEAKATTYRESMMLNRDPGMKSAGYNSSINGQLTLKYRLAEAVVAANKNDTEWLIEPRAVWKAYCDDMLKDPILAPRRLKKEKILNDILRPLMSDIRSRASFSYIALTWDTKDKHFFRDEEVTDEYLPRFLDAGGGGDLFSEMASQIGCLGYRQLKEALDLDGNNSFQLAFETMCHQIEPDCDYYSRKSRHALECLPEAVKSLADEISELFDKGRVVLGAGSYSVKDGAGRIIGKIIPRRSNVFLGFRADKETDVRLRERIDRVTMGKGATVRAHGANFIGYDIRLIEKRQDMEIARKLVGETLI